MEKSIKNLMISILGAVPVTLSPIGPNEVPPTFQQAPSGGVPMVTCRVCAAMIDISSKKEQHVVKCHQCQEATVMTTSSYLKNYKFEFISNVYLISLFI